MKYYILLFTLFISLSTKLYAQCNNEIPVSFPNGLIVECPDSDYELVFVDDFNGLEIDPTAWDKKYGDEKPFDKTKWPSHFTTPSNVRTSGYLIQDENLEISPN